MIFAVNWIIDYNSGVAAAVCDKPCNQQLILQIKRKKKYQAQYGFNYQHISFSLAVNKIRFKSAQTAAPFQ